MTNTITDRHLVGAGAGTQCFPFYIYDEDGSNRRDNITDWALEQFKAHLSSRVGRGVGGEGGGESEITKRDIFHYVYAVLHHPVYRQRYAENLKRELPRISIVGASHDSPLPGDFATFARLGEQLANLHLNYEQAAEYPLQWLENKAVPFTWRVERMKLSSDKTAVSVNDSLTLAGIPSEALNYRLGNRSALEWVIDQYRVSTDKASGLTSDPNRADDPEYIVRLIGRVITVSLETMNIIGQMPK